MARKKPLEKYEEMIPSREELTEYAKSIHPCIEKVRTNNRVGEGSINYFKTKDDFDIYYREWGNKNKDIKRIILCIHGLHSHGEKFVLFADKFVKYDWMTYAIDLRGHGLSWHDESDYGDISDYNIWINDVIEMIYLLNDKHPNIPVSLLGESMGGAVITHVASILQEEIKSSIMLSPALKPWNSVELGLIINALGFRNRDKPTKINKGESSLISNSAMYMEYQKTDKLRLKTLSPRYYAEIVKMLYQLKHIDFDSINFCPTCIFYGEKDNLIDFEGVKALIRLLKHKMKALHYIPSAFHELMTDLEAVRYGMYKKITQWFKIN